MNSPGLQYFPGPTVALLASCPRQVEGKPSGSFSTPSLMHRVEMNKEQKQRRRTKNGGQKGCNILVAIVIVVVEGFPTFSNASICMYFCARFNSTRSLAIIYRF